MAIPPAILWRFSCDSELDDGAKFKSQVIGAAAGDLREAIKASLQGATFSSHGKQALTTPEMLKLLKDSKWTDVLL